MADQFEYGMYNVNPESRVARWVQLKNSNVNKKKIQEIQTKPTDLTLEIQDIDYENDELVQRIKSFSFVKTWLGKWLMTRATDERQPKEAKTLWTDFCVAYADKILKLESDNLKNKSLKIDFRIYVMKQLESMYYSSRPLFTTLDIRSKATISDPHDAFQNILSNIEEFIYQTKSEEENLNIIRDPTFESMDQISTSTFESKTRQSWISGNRRPALFPQAEIQNAEFIAEDHSQEIPLSRITKKKFIKKQGNDRLALIKEEFC